jgi:hypothetical protein
MALGSPTMEVSIRLVTPAPPTSARFVAPLPMGVALHTVFQVRPPFIFEPT